MSKIRVLEVGKGQENQAAAPAELYLKGLEMEIVSMDVDEALEPDILHDIRTPVPGYLHGAFDIVFISHVMEHIEYRIAAAVLLNLISMLAPDGEIHIIVPDFEWLCTKVIRGEHSLAVAGGIFGGQNTEWDYHKSGYTLFALRALIDRLGLSVRQANTQTRFIVKSVVGDKEEETAIQQVYVVGMLTEW